jgi:hypothetical protein
MKITIPTAHHLLWSRDIFGNSVATIGFEEPTDDSALKATSCAAFLVELFPTRRDRDPCALSVAIQPTRVCDGRGLRDAGFPEDSE